MADTFTKISTVTVGAGGAATMGFTAIPQTFTDLCLKISGRSSRTGTTSGDSFSIAFNGVGGTSYSDTVLRGSGSAASSYFDVSASSIDLGRTSAAGQTANTFGNCEVYIPNYAGSNNKSIINDSVSENNATEAYQSLVDGLFSNTGAITSISVATSALGSWVQYSTATLYGISKS